MAVRYTEEQLNTVDKSLLIQMFLNQQEQLQTLTAEVASLNYSKAFCSSARYCICTINQQYHLW